VTAHVFAEAPARVYWELTRACDLACRHCRAEAMPDRAPDELDTAECERVLDSLATADPPPHVIFTGGDPLKRPDLVRLVRAARRRGLDVSVAPSATGRLTRDAVHELRGAGVSAMSLSLDGPDGARHDKLRGVLGCFGWTLAAAARIRGAEIPLQINTLVCTETQPHLEAIGNLVAKIGAQRWSLFFLIEVGRGRGLGQLSPRECELTLDWVARTAPRWRFVTTTTEAPHYRRVAIQRMRAAGRSPAEIHAALARGFGIRDGNGILFIAANGDVTPSGFLPVVAGNVRRADVLRLYREAPLFRALRAPRRFGAPCGPCTFATVCGGSRARAWAATGDPLASDPLCAWREPSPDEDREAASAAPAVA
jgi:radical SAM protein